MSWRLSRRRLRLSSEGEAGLGLRSGFLSFSLSHSRVRGLSGNSSARLLLSIPGLPRLEEGAGKLLSSPRLLVLPLSSGSTFLLPCKKVMPGGRRPLLRCPSCWARLVPFLVAWPYSAEDGGSASSPLFLDWLCRSLAGRAPGVFLLCFLCPHLRSFVSFPRNFFFLRRKALPDFLYLFPRMVGTRKTLILGAI